MDARLAQLRPLIEELFQLSGSPGLSLGVLHEGVPVFSGHFGRRKASEPTPPDDDTLYNIASFTKLMTAGVVSSLVEKGLLDWDVPVCRYLPEFGERNDAVGQKSTLTDLLANKTGLSAQATFWGVMFEDILPERQQIPRIASHIPAIGEFRNTFVYSSWGYALVTSAIERVTGKSFSVCVEEYIFRPLGMSCSTTNVPTISNVVSKHWVDLEGRAHEFPWSAYRGWCDELGFGGAVGARSSVKELLTMYQSLLHAYEHQTNNETDSTPGSPFKYVRRILSPHIGVGTSLPEKQGYCLGTYRSELPGNLSSASYNSILLQKKNSKPFGSTNAGRVIFHQVASFTGYNGSMLLDPQSQSAIVVMVNSLPLFDIADIVGQLLLATILGETDQADYVELAKSVVNANMLLYDYYTLGLQKKKTDKQLSLPIESYGGEYWNKDGIICYSVRLQGESQIRVSVRGSKLTSYILDWWGGDTFCLTPNRELEVSQSMWPFTSLKSRVFQFNCKEGKVASFTWHHDITPGSKPEEFFKNIDNSYPRL